MPADAPKSIPPLIVISYSKEEEKWKDQLVSLFPTDVDFRLMFNRVEEFPGRLDEETLSALPDAKVVLLMLSPTYLSNSWITNDQGELLLSLEKERGVRVLTLLVRYCSWEEIPFFRNRNEPLMIDVKPIAEGTPDEQTTTLQRIATRVLRLAGLTEPKRKAGVARRSPSQSSGGWIPNELERFTWTEEVDESIKFARLMAGSAAQETPISPACLLFGLTQAGELYSSESLSAAGFLLQELTAGNLEQYRRTYREMFPNWSRPVLRKPPVSPSTLRIFELAQTYSIRTIRLAPPSGTDIPGPLSDGTIHSRHLVAATLRIWHEEPWPGEMRQLVAAIDVAAVRQRFFDFILQSFPNDEPDEWQSILTVGAVEPTTESVATSTAGPSSETTEQAQQGFTPWQPLVEKRPDATATAEPADDVQSESDLRPALAGFATDYWNGKDLLNIEDDVNALASLVSAWSVEPPLSIGLFGDWGSGKSHFMRQMRQRVEKLSRKARKAETKKQNEIGYYKNIVQIEFNAWHYIEGNLWASLVDHIFANLRVTEKEKISIVEARRDELMNKLGVKKEIESKIKSKIEEQKNQLQVKKREATNLATTAEQKKDIAATQLAGFRSQAEEQLNQLQIPIKLSEKDKVLLRRVGIQPDQWTTVAGFRRHYDEVKGLRNRIAAQWKLFSTDAKVRRRFLLAAGLTLIPLVGSFMPSLSRTVTLPARLLAVVGLIGTFLTAALPIWRQFSEALSALEDHDAAVERERQKRMSELNAEVTALTQQMNEAKTEAAAIRREIEDLDHKIKTTTTSKILAEFIEDRAAAEDYRRHLGLLALIRRDFEKLRDLFEQQRTEEREGKETHDKNRINRIVLYIDDLDRCPPQRVVEVLQAIHLLLAFPIFVVVVGVDARWVTRSLQESYEWLRLDNDEGKKNGEKDDDEEGSTEGATPHDYLEKIFQIPFWLRPMEEGVCKSFIQGLTDQIRYRAPVKVDQDSNGDKKADAHIDSVPLEPIGDSVSGNGHANENDSDRDTGLKVDAPTNGAAGSESSPANDLEKSDESPATDAVLESDAGTNVLQGEMTAGESSEEQEQTTTASDSETGDEVDSEGDDDDELDLAPVGLTLSDHEIDYMTSLAKLIGRSPRAVKRFLNCYRLIKVSLPPAELKTFVQAGESYKYKAVMILLGVITGAPTVSLYLVEEIESWNSEDKTSTITDFSNKLEQNVDLTKQSDWSRLKTFFDSLTGKDESAEMFCALRDVTPRVSRYSFRIARAEAAGPKRAATAPAGRKSKTARQPTAS